MMPSEKALFERRHEPDARAALAERYDQLAQQLARRFRGRGTPIEDLVQVARFGLLNAIDRFDPDRGVRFSTFAGRTIIGELKHHFRDNAWSIRVPRSLQNLWLRTSVATEELGQQLGRNPTIPEIADHLEVDPEEVLEAMDAGTGFRASSLDRPVGDEPEGSLIELLGDRDRALERTPDWAELGTALESIPKRERDILYLRFYEGKTQQEIARIVGVSQVHVSRLLRGTLDELRERIG